MTVQEFLIKNRERDLYFRDEEERTLNVIFIPQGWCDDLTFANGCLGGPDFDPNNPEHVGTADGPEVYGYGASRLTNNDTEIAALWFDIEELDDEIPETEARQIHPNLFLYLEKLDAEGKT